MGTSENASDNYSGLPLYRKPSLVLLIFTICFSFWFSDFWKPYNVEKHENNFNWDVMNYYSYLPAIFCNNGSFDFHFGPDSLYLPGGPKGTFIPKTTYGMSVLYAPYFALGYKIAINQKDKLDGFSEPFATCVYWGSVIYVLIGMFLLRKFLLAYFSELVTCYTLFGVLFGTMLFIYTYSHSEFSHGYLFFLFTAFLCLCHSWYRKPTFLKTTGIGIIIALVSLIRPTDVLIFLFFMFWGVHGFSEIRPRFVFLLRMYRHFLLIFLIGVLFWIPQFLFWKQHAGTYFYFSYPGERFFWDDPQIMNILLSYRKGWITYTPLVLLTFAGMFAMKRPQSPFSPWFILSFMALMIYILSCWWDWFFGGCFGARGFCQYIAFLAVPLAAVFHWLFHETKRYTLRKLVAVPILLFYFSCVCLNLGQTYQYLRVRIHPYAMSKKIYWDVFRKYHFDDEYQHTFWGDVDMPDYEKLRSGEDRDQ